MNKYYVAYEDRGPSGPCGQTVENTAPWKKLYVFVDEVKARKFVADVTENPFKIGRLHPRITGFWSDDPHYDTVVDGR
mgnify:CR=1 FL=1